MSERDVEVPFAIEHIKGPDILDVGVACTGKSDYTDYLLGMGYNIESVDPVQPATYKNKFEWVTFDKKYDTVVFVSTLEHFNCSIENQPNLETEVFSIYKALSLLKEGGRIIITVPIGKPIIWRSEGFVVYSKEQIEKLKRDTKVKVLAERISRWFDDKKVWEDVLEASDAEYMGHGAPNAEAVYMGVWTK